MKVSKEDCPLCKPDGIVWRGNQRGCQSCIKCDHIIDKDIYKKEAKALIREIAKKNHRLQELKEILNLKEYK